MWDLCKRKKKRCLKRPDADEEVHIGNHSHTGAECIAGSRIYIKNCVQTG